MKMWVDDERPAPDATWDVYTTSASAISELRRLRHETNNWVLADKYHYLKEISLDHDLGGDDTGMKVINYMIATGLWFETVTVHTANPPARDRMLLTLNAEAPEGVEIYTKYWS